ncbi:MAG TPA: DotU family type IV/VI secretion system protein [Phycisphaerae bacterium]|jgi:type IV/VI secretion system ImpK/VasF family protein
MPIRLMELASPVFLYLAALRRGRARGVPIVPDAVHDELITILEEQGDRARDDPALAAAWVLAREPLVYLVDESLTRMEQAHPATAPASPGQAGWWSHHLLEIELLDHSEPGRAERFFESLHERLSAWEAGEHEPIGAKLAEELLTVYLTCLQFGFEGRYAGRPHELTREAHQIFTKLPAAARTQAKELFPDAYRHTIVMPPTYEPLMRVGWALAVLVAGVVTLFLFRAYLWHRLDGDLREATGKVSDFAEFVTRDAPATADLRDVHQP